MLCRQICVPAKLPLRLHVENPQTAEKEFSDMFDAAKGKLPLKENTPGLKIETAVAGPEAFVVTVFMQHGSDNTDLFIEAGDLPLNSPPEIQILSGDMRRAILRIPAPEDVDNLATELAGKKVTVTLVNRGSAVEREFSF
jgi:DsbC/DsbD-like thiol-disulfide interchange protein